MAREFQTTDFKSALAFDRHKWNLVRCLAQEKLDKLGASEFSDFVDVEDLRTIRNEALRAIREISALQDAEENRLLEAEKEVQ